MGVAHLRRHLRHRRGDPGCDDPRGGPGDRRAVHRRRRRSGDRQGALRAHGRQTTARGRRKRSPALGPGHEGGIPADRRELGGGLPGARSDRARSGEGGVHTRPGGRRGGRHRRSAAGGEGPQETGAVHRGRLHVRAHRCHRRRRADQDDRHRVRGPCGGHRRGGGPGSRGSPQPELRLRPVRPRRRAGDSRGGDRRGHQLGEVHRRRTHHCRGVAETSSTAPR